MKKKLIFLGLVFLISSPAVAGESQSTCTMSAGSLSNFGSELASLNRIIALEGNNGGASSGGGGDGVAKIVNGYLNCPHLEEISCDSNVDCVNALKISNPLRQAIRIQEICTDLLKAK